MVIFSLYERRCVEKGVGSCLCGGDGSIGDR